MKLVYLLLILAINLGKAFAQIDYYTPPHQRKIEDGQITLPNLRTEDTYFYLVAKGGFRFQNNSFSQPHNILQTSPAGDLTWEAALGKNVMDKWIYELGYLRNPLHIKWIVSDPDHKIPTLAMTQNLTENGLTLKLQRRLITFDKVSKRARIYATAGVKYGFSKDMGKRTSFAFITPIFSYGQTDTLTVQTYFQSPKQMLSGVLGFSLDGRLAEPLEIGIYLNCTFDTKVALQSGIYLSPSNGTPILSDLSLNRTSLFSGITIRWNFHHGIRYLPEKR